MTDVRQSSGGAFPDLVIERFVLGELPPAQMEAVARHLVVDVQLADRINHLRAANESGHLSGLAPGVKQRLDASRKARWIAIRRLVPLTAAIAVIVAAILPSLNGPSTDRIKGLDTSLVIFRQTAIGSEQLHDGDMARAGDLVRIGYRINATGFGVIVSVDGRGQVTLHHPGHGPGAAALEQGELVLLNQSYELDDAPDRERFFMITASRPFAVDGIVAEVTRQAAGRDVTVLRLPDDIEQSTFLLQKDSRP